MAKYKEIFGIVKEKMSNSKMSMNLAPEVRVNASAMLKTANKEIKK